MYFLPKNNWAYSKLVVMRPVQRWLLTMLCIMGVAYGWFFGIYIPLASMIDRGALANQTLDQEHVLVQQSHSTIEQLESTGKILANHLKQYKQKESTPAEALQNNMALIFGSAQRHGLVIKNYTVEKESAQTLFMNHHIYIELTGSLGSIVAMLNALHEQRVIMEYEHIELRRTTQNIFSLSLRSALSVLI